MLGIEMCIELKGIESMCEFVVVVFKKMLNNFM